MGFLDLNRIFKEIFIIITMAVSYKSTFCCIIMSVIILCVALRWLVMAAVSIY